MRMRGPVITLFCKLLISALRRDFLSRRRVAGQASLFSGRVLYSWNVF